MEHKPYWRNISVPQFKPLQEDINVGTVIVGAGMCGLLCAYLLLQKGESNIAVIDAGEICGGTTSGTTAKITCQHGLIYARLLDGLGKERTQMYLNANRQAIDTFEQISSQHNINCGFTRGSAWLYTTSESGVHEIEAEAEAAKLFGMDAIISTKTELTFPVKSALMFPGQAFFHPLKFAYAICDILVKSGVKIYTHTQALGARDGIVNTAGGNNIRAKNITSCSHYPFIDKPSLMFTKVFRERSYVLALENAVEMNDMYLDIEKDGLSFRPLKDDIGRDMLLLSAFDHKSGHESEKSHFDDLMLQAEKLYPSAKARWMWSAQDNITHDNIPYIGRWQSAGENIFIATGFNKWGMTSSMVAADIISEQIVNGKHEYEGIFCIDRRDIGLQAKSFIKESADIAGNFLTHLKIPDKQLDDVKRGEGAIVELNMERLGIYRDDSGKIYAVKPVCTHMGCAIKWNKDENTWDCTCHGSRFDYAGNVINGPAQKPLIRLEII